MSPPQVHAAAVTLGIVPYLNAAPLTATLPAGWQLRAGDPCELATWLRAGELDAALLPVAEALAGGVGPYLGRLGIACDGAVDSVLLFLPKGADADAFPAEVVLDSASRTSVRLARVVIERYLGRNPRYRTSSSPGPDPEASSNAATLVIGDRAMARRRRATGPVLDLGAMWKAYTGLPFVFARWTARAGLAPADVAALAAALDDAGARGMLLLDHLAATRGPAHGLTHDEARTYLGRTIRYVIGPDEEAGLARFAAEVVALGDP